MTTPLTGSYSEIRRDRAQRDPEFRRLVLIRAIKYFNENDLVMGKATLYEYIEDTMGFSELGKSLNTSSATLKAMLSSEGNPRADDLFAVIHYLKQEEGLDVEVTFKQIKPAPKVKARVKSTRKKTRITASEEGVYA